MYTSDTIGTLAGALAKAQGAIEAAAKDTVNPFFKSKYASLASVWEVARKPMSDNGLAVVQTTEATESGMILCTALIHSSGEWIHSFYPIRPVQDTPQGMGSALTYARRYSLSAMLGVVADDDDDGNAGSSGERKQQGEGTKQDTTQGNGKADPNAINATQLKYLNTLGSQFYGSEWETQRHDISEKLSKGRTKSSKELTKAEADTFIKGIERKIEAKKVVTPIEPAPTDGTQESMLQEAAAANEHSSWAGQAL